MRNILASIPKKDSIAFREQVKSLFRFTDTVLARQMKENIGKLRGCSLLQGHLYYTG
jgi:hypothetical protein